MHHSISGVYCTLVLSWPDYDYGTQIMPRLLPLVAPTDTKVSPIPLSNCFAFALLLLWARRIRFRLGQLEESMPKSVLQ